MKIVMIAALAVLSWIFIQVNAGRIEGRFYPVTEDTVIDRIELASDVRSRIWGTSRRVRDCAFEGLQWYLGDPRSNARVAVTFEEGAKVRPTGEMTFGPWVLHMTPQQVQRNSYAVVLHRCHPLWITETRFYP